MLRDMSRRTIAAAIVGVSGESGEITSSSRSDVSALDVRVHWGVSG